MTGSRVLEGVRLLELGEGVSAAFAGRNFAGFGAKVIKVEPPGRGDVSRRMGPYRDDIPEMEGSGLYHYLNAGKKSVTLDPSVPSGAQLLRHLSASVDAVIENFPPGSLSQWGCGPASLIEQNPKLVIVSVTPYGTWGPRASWKATNLTGFASGSQMAATGDPAREPLCTGGYQAEYQAGINAFAASMLALYVARRSGKGQYVEIAAQECMAAATEALGPLARHARDRRYRKGQRRYSFLGIYPCRDGWAGIFGTHQQKKQIAAALEMPGLLTDPRLQDVQTMVEHDGELTPMVEQFMAAHTKAELREIGNKTGLSVSPVETIEDIATSPHLNERGFFETVQHPFTGDDTFPGAPFKAATIPWLSQRAPLLGEHTNEVLQAELRLTLSDIAGLRAAGVI